MPPRNPELPEGTDHIINGAMETNAGTGASTGSSGGTGDFGGGGGSGGPTGGLGTGGTTGGLSGGGGTGGGSGPGFIGGSDTSVLGDDTGGLAGGAGGSSGGGGNFGSGGSSGGGQGGNAVNQLKGGAQNLKQQATSKVRDYAQDGKTRATTALDDFSTVIRETADSIDEKLGAEYGQYARRAADAVSDFAENIRNKEVDELYDDARQVVRKSPVVAIGAAAAIGFALVRLVKSGMPDQQRDVNFEPDPELGTTSSTQSQAPYVAPTTGA
jgi:ElaB/YqjD/DUF883 family membrane-anchored ribosome-binding protein